MAEALAGDRAPRSCSCPTARPSSTASPTCAWSSPSRGSPKPACRWSTSTRWAARTSWCSTAPPSCSTPTGALAAQAAELRGAAAAHPLAARRGRRLAGAARAPMAPPLAELEAIYRAMMLGLRDYVDKNRLPGRRPRPVGRHRFGALGRGRRRCAGARAGARGDDAVALHLAATASRMPKRWPPRSASGSTASPIEPAVAGLPDHAGPAVRRPAARHHRREHPGAHPRRDPDGDLEQARARWC